MLETVKAWGSYTLQALLDLLFPPQCAGCGQAGGSWCSACNSRFIRFSAGRCQRCLTPLAGKGIFCRACRPNLEQPLIASVGLYQGPLKRALLTLKYQADRELALIMADWLVMRWRDSGWDASVVVPVPLAAGRLRQRGYNQADLLASAFAATLGIGYQPEALRRIRFTSSQVGLDPTERWQNVAGAFQAKPGAFHGEQVLLIDDLCTTGATLRACYFALSEAKQTFGLTVAQA